MNQVIERIMSGMAFRTGGGIAHVVGRQAANGKADDDVLLLHVERFRGTPYRAFTTMQALALNLETGGWIPISGEDRLAA